MKKPLKEPEKWDMNYKGILYIYYIKKTKKTKCPHDSWKHVHVSLRSKPFIEQKRAIILHNSNSKNIYGQVENRRAWKLN